MAANKPAFGKAYSSIDPPNLRVTKKMIASPMNNAATPSASGIPVATAMIVLTKTNATKARILTLIMNAKRTATAPAAMTSSTPRVVCRLHGFHRLIRLSGEGGRREAASARTLTRYRWLRVVSSRTSPLSYTHFSLEPHD